MSLYNCVLMADDPAIVETGFDYVIMKHGESMLKIDKKYILNSNKKKVAVQIPIDTYQKIEGVLEDYALGQYIDETSGEKPLSVKEAKKYYGKKI